VLFALLNYSTGEGDISMQMRNRERIGKTCHKHRPTVEELEPRLVPSTINVLGYHFDNVNDGYYQLETTLTPTNVNSTTFGKLFTTQLDGKIYAEPLYKFGVNITRGAHQGIHNVVYVATEHDSLYAIDADNGQILWQDSFINPAAGINPVPNSDVNGAIGPEVGITGTPVIDPTTNTIYLDAATKETGSGTNHYVHKLWAVQLADGSNRFGSPVLIADTILNSDNSFTYVSGPTVNGTGDGSISGKLTFNAERQMQRPGLTLVNGTVYVGYGSYFDGNPYHGWILGFNHSTAFKLQLVAAFNATPNGFQGAFWQGGGRISADSAGNLYVETGNGTFDSTLNASQFPVNGDYGDTFLKLAADPTTSATNQSINGWGLKVVDYFTPFNQQSLDNQDLDIGSTAPLLLPSSVGTPGHPLLMGGGKEGRIYLIDTTNMGKFDPNTDHIPDEKLFSNFSTWGTSAFFNNQLYVVGAGSPGQTFSIVNNKFSSATSQSPDGFGYPGSTPYISANGTRNGIVWDLDQGSGELRAYNAATYATELYTTSQNSARDQLGSIPTYAVPTVAHGKVYVGTTSNTLVVYGLLPHATASAAVSSGGAPALSEDFVQALAGLASDKGRVSAPVSLSLSATGHAAPLNRPADNASNSAELTRTGSGRAISLNARLHKPSSPTDAFWEIFPGDAR
jgi:PQQ enzyme repeat